ncbi:MAG: hypothetical protein IJX77_03375 [Ruminococcus sp.]|nr:hypothetical protein [Ruminococcus sp.]
MSKIKEFFLGLSKSTRMTLISCGCFVLLTFLILIFFVMFPITPSEKAIAKIGREGLVYQDGDENVTVTTTVTTTTNTVTTTQTTTTTVSETRITYTTMGGFFSEGYINTGTVGEDYYESSTETVQPEPEYPYEPETPYEPATEPASEEATAVPTSPVEIVTQPPQEATDPVPEPTEPPAAATDPPAPEPTAPPAPAPTDPPAAQNTEAAA